jgi:hypothetical protein
MPELPQPLCHKAASNFRGAIRCQIDLWMTATAPFIDCIKVKEVGGFVSLGEATGAAVPEVFQ